MSLELDQTIILRGELPYRTDLIGKEVLCLESWWGGYEKGKVYTVLASKHYKGCIALSNTSNFNGCDAKWQVLNSDPLKPEDFL
jgi:hypothetical protein